MSKEFSGPLEARRVNLGTWGVCSQCCWGTVVPVCGRAGVGVGGRVEGSGEWGGGSCGRLWRMRAGGCVEGSGE